MSKIKENNDYINDLRSRGILHCFKGELPHPKCANRCFKNGPILAIENNKIYFKSLEN